MTKTFNLMGTIINLALDAPDEKGVLELSFDILKNFERRFSLNDENSMLNLINKNAGIKPIKVDEDLFNLIKIGKDASIKTKTNFNIAIGTLVKLWNIGFNNEKVPSQKEIEQALKLINPKDIILDENIKTVYLQKKGMKIDLGGLAKGYFADLIRNLWIDKGISSGLIDIGRNIHTIGGSKKQNYEFWKIAIKDPLNQNKTLDCDLEIKNKSIVTSGIYERKFEESGKIYHHILSSKTGYPVDSDIASISIISDSSLMAEIYSTALISENANDALYIIKKMKNIDAIIIDKNGQVFNSLI